MADVRALAGAMLLVVGCSGAPSGGGARPLDEDVPIEDLKRTPPAGAHLLGTDHPFTLEAVGRGWVVMCQAREDTNKDGAIRVSVGMHGDTWGDELVPYLISSEGPGEELDTLVDTDLDGRRLLAIQNGRLLLIEPETGKKTDLSALGADTSDDDDPLRIHRAASFDETGERVVYQRPRGGKAVIVVREIASGAETEIDPGEGKLWRAAIDGEFVLVTVIARDTDHNGRLEIPRPRTSLSDRACRAPIVSYSVSGRAAGDDPDRRIGSIHGGPVRPFDETIVAVAGAWLLRREPDGALVQVTKDGASRELSPPACGAKVLVVDPAREAVIVACGKASADESPVELHTAGKRVSLGFTIPRPKEDFTDVVPRGVRLIAVGPIIDLEKQVSIPVPKDDRVIDIDGAHVLFAREAELFWRDLDSGAEQRFEASGKGHRGARRKGPLIAARGLVIDVGSGKLLGRYAGTPLALGHDGRLLFQPGHVPREDRLPRGPLWWEAPSAPEPSLGASSAPKPPPATIER